MNQHLYKFKLAFFMGLVLFMPRVFASQENINYDEFQAAISRCDSVSVQKMLADGADANFNYLQYYWPEKSVGFWEKSPLALALDHCSSNLSVAKALINAGANLRYREKKYENDFYEPKTYLEMALTEGAPARVEEILTLGSDANEANPYNDWTPVLYLIPNCLECGAGDPKTDLASNIQKLHSLVKHGANLNRRDRSGMTPVEWTYQWEMGEQTYEQTRRTPYSAGLRAEMIALGASNELVDFSLFPRVTSDQGNDWVSLMPNGNSIFWMNLSQLSDPIYYHFIYKNLLSNQEKPFTLPIGDVHASQSNDGKLMAISRTQGLEHSCELFNTETWTSQKLERWKPEDNRCNLNTSCFIASDGKSIYFEIGDSDTYKVFPFKIDRYQLDTQSMQNILTLPTDHFTKMYQISDDQQSIAYIPGWAFSGLDAVSIHLKDIQKNKDIEVLNTRFELPEEKEGYLTQFKISPDLKKIIFKVKSRFDYVAVQEIHNEFRETVYFKNLSTGKINKVYAENAGPIGDKPRKYDQRQFCVSADFSKAIVITQDSSRIFFEKVSLTTFKSTLLAKEDPLDSTTGDGSLECSPSLDRVLFGPYLVQ